MKSQTVTFLMGGGALWLFSAVAHSLPAPSATLGNPFYAFFYNFVQALAANLSKIGEKS